MIKESLVNLGVRVTAQVKHDVTDYCFRNGIKVQFFVDQAIREKLSEVQEQQLDMAIADERMNNPRLTGDDKMRKYMTNRKAKK